MTTLRFFGDSWPSERDETHELALAQGLTPKSYPQLVSEILNLPYKNYSVNGTSQQHNLVQLMASNIQPGDHAIFSLTSPYRKMYYDEQGRARTLGHATDPMLINDYNETWLSANICFTLYYYCLSRGSHAWFINTFDTSAFAWIDQPLWQEIPELCWLMPSDQCVAQLFDPEFFQQTPEYKSYYFKDWLDSDNAQVQKYIRPNVNHPNQAGRELIAKKIADELSQRISVKNK